MNWEAIGALSDLFGALAVVVTLVFLLFELRESRKVAQSSSVDLLAAGWNTLNTALMGDAELTSIFFTGINDPKSLKSEQFNRFVVTCQSYVNHFMTVKKHYEAGHLPEEEWQYHSMGIAHIMNSPGGKAAREIIAVTPTVQALLEEYETVDHKDGYLGVSKSDTPVDG